MRSQILLCLSVVSLSSAKAQFDLNRQAEETVVEEVNEFVAGVAKDPELQTLDIPAIEKIVPTSVVASAETNPANLIEAIVQDSSNTALIGSLPGPVVASLRKLLAKPLKAVADIEKYIQQLIASPGVGEALISLEKAVPADLSKQIEANPVPFLENLVTATTVPAWIAAIPTPVQKELASILNEGFSIIEADFAGATSGASYLTASKPKPTHTTKSKGSHVTSAPYATATGSSKASGGTGAGAGTATSSAPVGTITPPATVSGGSGGSTGSGGSAVNGSTTSSIEAFSGGATKNYQAVGMGIAVFLGLGIFAAM